MKDKKPELKRSEDFGLGRKGFAEFVVSSIDKVTRVSTREGKYAIMVSDKSKCPPTPSEYPFTTWSNHKSIFLKKSRSFYTDSENG